MIRAASKHSPAFGISRNPYVRLFSSCSILGCKHCAFAFAINVGVQWLLLFAWKSYSIQASCWAYLPLYITVSLQNDSSAQTTIQVASNLAFYIFVRFKWNFVQFGFCFVINFDVKIFVLLFSTSPNKHPFNTEDDGMFPNKSVIFVCDIFMLSELSSRHHSHW